MISKTNGNDNLIHFKDIESNFLVLYFSPLFPLKYIYKKNKNYKEVDSIIY